MIDLLALLFVLSILGLIIGAVLWPMRRMNDAGRRRYSNWIIVVSVLIILSTCIDWTDIRVLEESMETKDDEASMYVSVGPDVTGEELTAWVSRKCRDIMVLPPIEPVPIEVRKRDDGRVRTEYMFRCTRP